MANQDVIISLKGESAGLRNAATNSSKALGTLNKRILAIARNSGTVNGSISQTRDSMGRYTSVVKDAKSAAAELITENKRLVQVGELLKKSLSEEELAALRASGALRSIDSASSKAAISTKKVAAETKKSTTAAMTGTQALSRLGQRITRLTQSNITYNSSLGRLQNSQGRMVGVVQQARQVAAQLSAEKQRSIQINQLLEKSLKKEELAILRSTGAMNSMKGAAGSSSFALLSLTQGVQDAGNFGMGMAQGIRAVNNNLQAFVTAMTFSVAQSGGLKNALAGMGKAMLGPAGILFAFSAVSAAIEFFSNRSQQAKGDVKDLADAYDDAISSLVEFEDKLSGRKFFIPEAAIPGVIETLETDIEEIESVIKTAGQSLSTELGGAFSSAMINAALIDPQMASIVDASGKVLENVNEQHATDKEIVAARAKRAAMSEDEIRDEELKLEAAKSLLKQFEAQQAQMERLKIIRADLARQGFTLADADKRSKTELSESEKIMVKIASLRSFIGSQEESMVGVLSVELSILDQLKDVRQEQIGLEETLRRLRQDPEGLVADIRKIQNTQDLNEALREKIRLRLEDLELQGVISGFEKDEILAELDLGDKLETEADNVDRQMARLNAAFARGISSGVAGFLGGIADLAAGVEKNPAAALLEPFADMAINLGKIAIATGITLEGIKTAFQGNPATAIAAGIALIAVGKFVKSKIAAAGASVGAGSASGSGFIAAPGIVGGSFDFGTGREIGADILVGQTGQGTTNVSGRFVIEGRDLVAVVSNEVERQIQSGRRTQLMVS